MKILEKWDMRTKTDWARAEFKKHKERYAMYENKNLSGPLGFILQTYQSTYRAVKYALEELYNMRVASVIVTDGICKALQVELDYMAFAAKEIDKHEGRKKILGREVEWSCEDKKVYIHLNYDDKLRMAKQKEELGAVDYTDNDEITVDYFNNDEFQEIHDRVFPSTKSWQQDFWSDEDRGSYLEIRVAHPSDEE